MKISEAWKEADPKEINSVVNAIVEQAVTDWRNLCKCKRKDKNCWACRGVDHSKPRPNCISMATRDCNFKELEFFFGNECGEYIDQDIAERIYKQLKLERRKAGFD